MSYTAGGSLMQIDDLSNISNILISNGWTILTAINVMLFCLMHFPCSTTLITIRKESGSLKWTALAFLIPTFLGIIKFDALEDSINYLKEQGYEFRTFYDFVKNGEKGV